MAANGGGRQESLFLVELVGLAGAGKTTLSRALRERDENILLGPEIEMRKAAHIPVLCGNAPFLLPVMLCANRRGRWPTWDEIKAMVYLRAWPAVLRRQATDRATTIVLDHGPVFKLATLHAFGPEGLGSQNCRRWWNGMFEQWASSLDMIVWLDAPETLLVTRINSRSRGHAIKGKPEVEAFQYLARYRTSYTHVLASLGANGAPAPLRFDTSHTAVQEIADEVLAALALRPKGQRPALTART